MQLINHNHITNYGNKSSCPVSSIFIKEDEYCVKNIMTETDRLKAHHLRYRIFCEELGWIQHNSNMLEIDDYDRSAIFFGVYDTNENLKAYLRILLSNNSFMLEKNFYFLLESNDVIRKQEDTIEISRLCVAPEARHHTFSDNFGVHKASMLLYKGVYHWCLNNDKRYLYMVVEQKIFRMLCAKGFPCELVGKPKKMPDGVVAVAAILDWRKFEEKNTEKSLMKWFSDYQSGPPLTQLLQHEFYSLHQVWS